MTPTLTAALEKARSAADGADQFLRLCQHGEAVYENACHGQFQIQALREALTAINAALEGEKETGGSVAELISEAKAALYLDAPTVINPDDFHAEMHPLENLIARMSLALVAEGLSERERCAGIARNFNPYKPETTGAVGLCERIAQAILSGHEAEGWRDIATAPKDGTTVLLVRVYGMPPYTMGTGHFGRLHPNAPSLQPMEPDPLGRDIPDYRPADWGMSPKWLRDDAKYLFPEPTHWRPLPSPPRTA